MRTMHEGHRLVLSVDIPFSKASPSVATIARDRFAKTNNTYAVLSQAQ